MSSQLKDRGFNSQSELHASRSNRQPIASVPFYTMFDWRNPRVSTDDGEGAKSRTGLTDFTSTFHFHALEKEVATHSSVLAWRIPGKGEPGGLPSMGLWGHTESDTTKAT